MNELEARHFDTAEQSFAAILSDYPDDGPARFQRERCRQFAITPPTASPWVVNMDSK